MADTITKIKITNQAVEEILKRAFTEPSVLTWCNGVSIPENELEKSDCELISEHLTHGGKRVNIHIKSGMRVEQLTSKKFQAGIKKFYLENPDRVTLENHELVAENLTDADINHIIQYSLFNTIKYLKPSEVVKEENTGIRLNNLTKKLFDGSACFEKIIKYDTFYDEKSTQVRIIFEQRGFNLLFNLIAIIGNEATELAVSCFNSDYKWTEIYNKLYVNNNLHDKYPRIFYNSTSEIDYEHLSFSTEYENDVEQLWQQIDEVVTTAEKIVRIQEGFLKAVDK